MTDTEIRLREQAREHLLKGEEGDYIKADDGSIVEVVDWCGGRYAMYDCASMFCGVTSDVEEAVEFLLEADVPAVVTLYGVEMSVEALKAELRSAYRSSLLNPSREYLVMLDRNSGRLWTHERHLGDTRTPLLHRCVPLYAFRDFGEDILTEWYWGNLYDSERNEAVEEYTDCETWEGIKADAEQFGCEPWELALEDRDIRLHFRNEAADAFLDDYDGRASLECIYDIVLEEAAAWAKEAAR